jgi:hypothetical protein
MKNTWKGKELGNRMVYSGYNSSVLNINSEEVVESETTGIS